MAIEILIVDDNSDIRNILNELLLDEGYKTRLAANFNQALSEIDKKIPDIAILDVKLPVPFLIGSGNLLYPLAIGFSIALSNPILKLNTALLVFSKHSLLPLADEEIRNIAEKIINTFLIFILCYIYKF